MTGYTILIREVDPHDPIFDWPLNAPAKDFDNKDSDEHIKRLNPKYRNLMIDKYAKK